jgi:hypothetical protein
MGKITTSAICPKCGGTVEYVHVDHDNLNIEPQIVTCRRDPEAGAYGCGTKFGVVGQLKAELTTFEIPKVGIAQPNGNGNGKAAPEVVVTP